MFDSWIAAADGWIVRDDVSTYFISPVGLLGYRQGIIAPCADGKGLGAAIAWLDEQLRKEAKSDHPVDANYYASWDDSRQGWQLKARIDGWTESLAAPKDPYDKLATRQQAYMELQAQMAGRMIRVPAEPEMVPLKIVRHEKPHCRYWLDPFEENAERVVLASTPLPTQPACNLAEPGALNLYHRMCRDAQIALRRDVKRTIREWPLCSVTGEAVPLRIDEHGDELIAYWCCRCGEEELP